MARKLAKRGSHRKTRSVKGWSRAAPKRKGEKIGVLRRCGVGAFLRINKQDPVRSGYPIVAARGRGCKPDCRGLRAAYSRANQQGSKKIGARALRIAKSAGCEWAKRHAARARRRR